MWCQALTLTLDCWFESNPAKLDWCLALTHPTYCYICCERSQAPVWTHPQLPREHHISSFVSHITGISFLRFQVGPVDARPCALSPGVNSPCIKVFGLDVSQPSCFFVVFFLSLSLQAPALWCCCIIIVTEQVTPPLSSLEKDLGNHPETSCVATVTPKKTKTNNPKHSFVWIKCCFHHSPSNVCYEMTERDAYLQLRCNWPL